MERSENKPAAELTPSPTLARRPRPGERWRLHDDLARLERRSVSGALVLARFDLVR